MVKPSAFESKRQNDHRAILPAIALIQEHNYAMDLRWAEAAERLKLSPATIRRLIAARELTAIRSGRRKWLVPEEAIAEYRTRQTSTAVNSDAL
jgi:excisionase family DNA binding protein